MIAFPKYNGEDGAENKYKWSTSLGDDSLKKMSMPIGLLGHSAIVIKKEDGTELIHVFGGMWGKLSNYQNFRSFYEEKGKKALATQKARYYNKLYVKNFLQTWDNAKASNVPSERRSALKFQPNHVWAPNDVSYAITHNAVGRLSLIFDGEKWNRGPRMHNRRFGHTTIMYGDSIYHIGGHIPNDGSQRYASSLDFTRTIFEIIYFWCLYKKEFV